MLRPRVIPILLLHNGRLVKTRQFGEPRYIGDPVNAARIYNELNADELAVLDISATLVEREPDYDLILRIADRLFMPFCYGGGIALLEDAQRVFDLGVERVVINTAAIESPGLVTEIATQYGSQAVTVSLDVMTSPRGEYVACVHSGKRTGLLAEKLAPQLVELGAGEILLQSVDRDGMMNGYDLELIERITSLVGVPVIAAGGAATPADFDAAIAAGASAAAAGSMFVYNGPHKAVLIQYERGEV